MTSRPPFHPSGALAREYAVADDAVTEITVPDGSALYMLSLINGSDAHPATAPVYFSMDGSDPDPTQDPATCDFIDKGCTADVPAAVGTIKLKSASGTQYVRVRLHY